MKGKAYKKQLKIDQKLSDKLEKELKSGYVIKTEEGNQLLEKKKYPQAIEAFKKAFELSENSYQQCYAKIYLGEALKKQLQFGAALEEYNNAILLNKFNSRAYLGKGQCLSIFGKFEEALIEFDKAIQIDSENIETLNCKGKCLSSLKKFEEAIKWHNQALDLEYNLEAFNLKAVCLNNMEKYNEAIEIINQALKTYPDADELYYQKGQIILILGLSLFQLGHFDQALEQFNKSISINPNQADYYFHKGFCLQKLIFYNLVSQLKQYQQSIKSTDAYLAIHPNNIPALELKAKCLQSLKKQKEALKTIDQALAIDPTRSSTLQLKSFIYFVNLAEFLFENNNVEGPIKQCKKKHQSK